MVLCTALPHLFKCDRHMIATPERDLRVSKSPAWRRTLPKLQAKFAVQTLSLNTLEGLFFPRAREPAANENSGRSRDKYFTRILTDLYSVVSSAFRGFAPASNRSSSDFGRLARIPDREAPSQRASCQPSTQPCQMWDNTGGSHGSTTKLPSQCCHPNGTSPCTFELFLSF